MVRIRVKIIRHDGVSKKEALWQGLNKAEAYVYKMLQAKEAFFLVTDGEQAERILKPEIRDFLKGKGLEIQVPPEYMAMRTVMVKGLEWCVAELSNIQIQDQIETNYPNWKIEKVIKIPNNSKLMKLVCKSARTAEEIVNKGIVISNQKFAGRSLERETYVNITPCFRYYSYDHIMKRCTTSSTYKICSECSKDGHRFNECTSSTKKCINCGQDHKTTAFKCPVRKEILRQKIANMKKKKEPVSESDIRKAVERQIKEDLPNNYLAVIASAVTLADMREMECPGTFQYIMEEMYLANNLPKITFPATVIAGYQYHKTKKRTCEGSEEIVEGVVGGTIYTEEYIITPLETLVTSSSMPMPSPLAVPSTPTPANTPVSTPASTTVQSSLRREDTSIKQKPPMAPAKKKEKKRR